MSNVVSMDQKSALVVPDYLKSFDVESNITDGGSRFPTLSVRGKVFRVNIDGNETIVQYPDPSGELVPAQSIQVVVLDQGPVGARVYYGASYDPESSGRPKCFSLDGKRPDPSSPEPQSKICDMCPQSVKGTRTTLSGMPTTACVLQRRLAVLPVNDLTGPVLLLRLAPTSAYDKNQKDPHWFAWRQYVDFLASKGVTHTAQVVTRMRFDPSAETPKLVFKPERFLSEEEASVILPRIKSAEVRAMLYPQDDGAPSLSPAVLPKTSALPPAEDHENDVIEDSVDDDSDNVEAEAEAVAEPAVTPALQRRPMAPRITTDSRVSVDDLLAAWDE